MCMTVLLYVYGVGDGFIKDEITEDQGLIPLPCDSRSQSG